MITFSTIPVGGEIYNLTSLYEGYTRLYLLPPFVVRNSNTYEFDINYANWIFGCEQAYNDFMNIIYKYIQGVDITILILDFDMYDYIIESLEKLLSERYGIVSNRVYTIEDWYDCTDVGPRKKEHIINLNNDMENFSNYLVNKGVKEF